MGSPDSTHVRALVLLLLLANLLFAGWALWIAPPPVVSGHATPSAPGASSIRLLREMPPAQEPGLAAEVGEANVDLATVACVSAGPYLERQDADQVIARLLGQGFDARLRPSHEAVRVGHWVRLESLATPEDATNVLGALNSAGVADAYVLTDEGEGTIVSLGVFADAARAAETVAAARAAGFEPRTVDRLREADVFWLDIEREENAGLPSLEQLHVRAGGASLEPELRPCPAPEPTPPTPAARAIRRVPATHAPGTSWTTAPPVVGTTAEQAVPGNEAAPPATAAPDVQP
jgi:hypothetical protein